MKLKKFLRLDWRRIAMFLIILIIGTLAPTFLAYCDISPFAGVCAPGTVCTYSWFQLIKISEFFEKYGARHPCGIVSYDTDIFYMSLSIFIINIIFWYLISCIIVWTYDKYLKKVKKK
jgi:hypothetical protein